MEIFPELFLAFSPCAISSFELDSGPKFVVQKKVEEPCQIMRKIASKLLKWTFYSCILELNLVLRWRHFQCHRIFTNLRMVKNDVGSHAIKIIRANPQKDVFLWVIYSWFFFCQNHSFWIEKWIYTKSLSLKMTYEKGGIESCSMVCEFLLLMSDEIRGIIY